MKKIIQIILLVIVAGLIVTAWDGFYILQEGQQAIITQFGAPVGTPITAAGLKWKTPFIQHVQFFEKRILIWDGEPNQIPTNDKTFIYIETTARWRIANALRFLQAVGTENRAQTLLDDIINGTVRDLVSKNNLIEIIRSSDWTPAYMAANKKQEDAVMVPPKLGRDKISQRVLNVASKMTEKYGIKLVDVMFKRVNYIESVRKKVYERMISERQRIAAKKRSLGEGRKAEILGQVERKLKEITSTAQKEATMIKGQADAKATEIYGETYSKHPEFYAFEKSLASYQKILTKNTTLILSSNSELFKYLDSTKKSK
ncbi:modulator of FtsH protease HflC [bacterium BMS3Bbin14]|nr:modulator of FtsH protease HflC [bacterium BMS3Abin13]GBE52198.1 modulator of FtsH protease HflC [bacterium BMS3Bbin14]HDK43472.1 protease modulator HflC [Desulfobacteraceae bacterium]HDO30399.1 protease modulator HflC [Desulfobacteraceae bacterium]